MLTVLTVLQPVFMYRLSSFQLVILADGFRLTGSQSLIQHYLTSQKFHANMT